MPMKKSRTQDTAADFARRSNATSRMNRPPQGMPADEMPSGGPDASPLAPQSPEKTFRPARCPAQRGRVILLPPSRCAQ
jgi:hypothetical protein